MRPRSAFLRLTRGAIVGAALALIACASAELPLPPRPDSSLLKSAPTASARLSVPRDIAPALFLNAPRPVAPRELPAPPVADVAVAPPPVADVAVAPPPSSNVPYAPEPPAPELPPPRCASVPPLLPNGATPPAPPHAPLGQEVAVPGDRPAYVLPGEAGDSRVIIYLPGMCGDATAADYFRESAKAHGTLISVRGDTPCDNGRFKWRDDPAKIQARIQAAFDSVNAQRGGDLRLEPALLFGYSQGADRAEKVAALFPKQYPRVVLGGPPLKPSPRKLAHAERVVVFGGELETTDNMRAGFDALQAAGIASRWFTIECAYHGYFGTNAESQFGELLDWVSQP
jgi:predicted esterase